jgi:hypothetical protein
MRWETSFRSRRTAWREDVLQGRGRGKEEEEEPRFPKEPPHRRATVMDARCVARSRRAIAWVRIG